MFNVNNKYRIESSISSRAEMNQCETIEVLVKEDRKFFQEQGNRDRKSKSSNSNVKLFPSQDKTNLNSTSSQLSGFSLEVEFSTYVIDLILSYLCYNLNYNCYYEPLCSE